MRARPSASSASATDLPRHALTVLDVILPTAGHGGAAAAEPRMCAPTGIRSVAFAASSPTSCWRSGRSAWGRVSDRRPMKFADFFLQAEAPRSSGIVVPSVSMPTTG